jgi:hypothetical protein
MVHASMHSPAIQAALDNLVETVRTSVTAEFLEFFRGDAKPMSGRAGRKPGQAPKRKQSARRSSEAGERIAKLVVSHLKKHPDSRLEQIAAALGSYSTKDLALPIKKLLTDKLIIKKGQRRGTTYRAR